MLESPITPSASPATVPGRYTGVELAKYVTPRGSLKVLSVVWKAADTRALDPLARTRNGEDDGVTVRPLPARKLATEAWVDAVGAKRASNCPLVSQ